MNTQLRIRYLAKAKKRLGSAIKRFRQAEEFIEAFFEEVPPESKNKKVWGSIPPEYQLLLDCQDNIRGVRQQTLRLLFQIHLTHFHERQRKRLENMSGPSQDTDDDMTKKSE